MLGNPHWTQINKSYLCIQTRPFLSWHYCSGFWWLYVVIVVGVVWVVKELVCKKLNWGKTCMYVDNIPCFYCLYCFLCGIITFHETLQVSHVRTVQHLVYFISNYMCTDLRSGNYYRCGCKTIHLAGLVKVLCCILLNHKVLLLICLGL